MSDATHRHASTAGASRWRPPTTPPAGRHPLRPRRPPTGATCCCSSRARPERPTLPAPVAAADRRGRGDVTDPAGRTWWRRPGAATGRRSRSCCAPTTTGIYALCPPHHRQRRRRRRRHPGGADRHRPRPPPLRRPLAVLARGRTASPPTPASTSCAAAAGVRCLDLPDERADRRRHRSPPLDTTSPTGSRLDAALAELPGGLPRRRRAARRLRPRLRRDRRGAGAPARHRALPHRPGRGAGWPTSSAGNRPTTPARPSHRTMSDLSPPIPPPTSWPAPTSTARRRPTNGPPSRPTPRLGGPGRGAAGGATGRGRAGRRRRPAVAVDAAIAAALAAGDTDEPAPRRDGGVAATAGARPLGHPAPARLLAVLGAAAAVVAVVTVAASRAVGRRPSAAPAAQRRRWRPSRPPAPAPGGGIAAATTAGCGDDRRPPRVAATTAGGAGGGIDRDQLAGGRRRRWRCRASPLSAPSTTPPTCARRLRPAGVDAAVAAADRVGRRASPAPCADAAPGGAPSTWQGTAAVRVRRPRGRHGRRRQPSTCATLATRPALRDAQRRR